MFELKSDSKEGLVRTMRSVARVCFWLGLAGLASAISACTFPQLPYAWLIALTGFPLSTLLLLAFRYHFGSYQVAAMKDGEHGLYVS